MQHHYSPLKKLENLLRVIFIAIGNQNLYECSNGDGENFDYSITTESKIKRLPPADGISYIVYFIFHPKNSHSF